MMIQCANIRTDWTSKEIQTLFDLPLLDLLYRAQTVHRQYFEPNTLQICQLLSIKTGACPEDCGYCGQSGHHKTGLKKENLMDLDKILEAAKNAKEKGVTRFCMGAAWRSPPDNAMSKLCEIIQEVKKLGLETCITAGMLTEEQAEMLVNAGLDFYNHNLDTSPRYYKKITSTRTYEDRLQTLKIILKSGIKVCCGGIIGMGENREDRIELLRNIATLQEHPKSVPINLLNRVEGTPLFDSLHLEPTEMIRMIAVARLLMPASYIRLAAGRSQMSDETQILCFMAGANSIFYGTDKLLTTPNPSANKDDNLLKKMNMKFTVG